MVSSVRMNKTSTTDCRGNNTDKSGEKAAKARLRGAMAAQKPKGNNPKRAKKDPLTPAADDGDDEDDEENLEQLMEGMKRKWKTASISSYVTGGTSQYVTTSEDRQRHMMAKQERLERELEEAKKNAPPAAFSKDLNEGS